MSAPQPIALIDVRCMYVSCERLIDGTLRHQPVIVLSNNDGCAVSRSDEAKALGVAMGKPWFEIQQDALNRPELWQVIARSSNYELYGDMAARFTATIDTLALGTEVYSIDECFAYLLRHDPESAAAAIRDRVLTWTGLPTAAGVGTTKTLAKVAQRAAKADPTTNGLLDLSGWPRHRIDELLRETPLIDVWGIGNRLSRSLNAAGVRTALDLARADPGWVRRRWNVVLERTARELAGTPCMPVGHEPRTKQQIIYSRMLGHPVETRSEMSAVLAQYAAMASRRLRTHELDAALMTVSMSTSRFRDKPLSHHLAVALDPPTSDPLRLIAAAKTILPKMREGRPYNRAGIMLTGLTPSGAQPTLTTSPATQRSEALVTALDAITAKYGRRAIGAGHTGLHRARPWDMKRDMLSPPATTRWDQLLTVQ